ncbi:hypothetical protein Q0O84_13945, partial [Staphylococcus aureus]|nr:hypothetical protein [Staphylococcus aureus]
SFELYNFIVICIDYCIMVFTCFLVYINGEMLGSYI